MDLVSYLHDLGATDEASKVLQQAVDAVVTVSPTPSLPAAAAAPSAVGAVGAATAVPPSVGVVGAGWTAHRSVLMHLLAADFEEARKNVKEAKAFIESSGYK